jgi:hypothetical protein
LIVSEPDDNGPSLKVVAATYENNSNTILKPGGTFRVSINTLAIERGCIQEIVPQTLIPIENGSLRSYHLQKPFKDISGL